MAAVIENLSGAWASLAPVNTALQNAVPDTFKKVEIPSSGTHSGKVVCYDADDNICLVIGGKSSNTLYFRDGTSQAVNLETNWISVTAHGVILSREGSAQILIAKDHRGKIAFANTNSSASAFLVWNGDSSANAGYDYKGGQETDQTNLCRFLCPKGGEEANWLENAFVSIQYELNTSPKIVTIDDSAYIAAWREYLKD